ncbi:hypothetical protein [Sorangium sp. So ce124]|uniref:hypothetical protein n=1 Tax=Sorangium sp. So ce124 TaxID=3133280 RepID=UPI003F621A78
MSPNDASIACAAWKKFFRASAVVLTGLIANVMVPACTIKLNSGIDNEEGSEPAAGYEPPPDEGPKTDNEEDSEPAAGYEPPPDEGPKTPEEQAEETFAQMDPEELALASAKASFTTYALAGMIESLNLDPATLDEAAIAELMTQYMPLAVAEADRWLSTIDTSTLPRENNPNFECKKKYGCPYITGCQYAVPGHSLPTVRHACMVNDCGDARCRNCPDWVGDILSHLLFRAWCSYVCIEEGVTNAKIVAVGAGAISSFGGYFVGPICRDP